MTFLLIGRMETIGCSGNRSGSTILPTIHQAYICFHLYKTHHSNPFMLYNHPSIHKSNTTTDGIFFQKKSARWERVTIKGQTT